MLCHEAVLRAAKRLVEEKKINEFTAPEVAEVMEKEGRAWSRNTIRRTISSRCCIDYPKNEYRYFQKVRRGVYKVL